MVQLDMGDLNLISRTIEMVKNKGLQSSSTSPATIYNSTSGSPSKTSKKPHKGSPKSLLPMTSPSSTPKLISYAINPVPTPPPLPPPLGCLLRWCCGGNMKWLGFPLLCAVSLGLFLAFNKAASVGQAVEPGYSFHLNSRKLSDDEPELMAQMPGLLGRHINDHNMLFGHPALHQGAIALPGQVGQCDCARCDEEQEIFYPTEARYRKLVKHSLQHFYGRRELALSIASFVPYKRKVWYLGFALYTTASQQCQGLAQPEAVVLVMSEVKHREERDAIRTTWGSVAKGTGWPHRRMTGDVRVIFVMGVSQVQGHNELVTREAETHGDVVLVDIPEGPENMSKKVLSGFKWVQMYCSQAQYVVKVNEDIFLDLPRLLELLANQEMANMIYGPIVIAEPVPREASSAHPIVISRRSYAPDWFPPHAQGYFYAMPTELTNRLLEVAESLPYMAMEDAFVTGVLAKVFDARHINVPKALFDRTGPLSGELCDFVFRSKMAVKGVSPEVAKSKWRRIERPEMCGLMPEAS